MDTTLSGPEAGHHGLPEQSAHWRDELDFGPLTLDQARDTCAWTESDDVLRTVLGFEIGLPKQDLLRLVGEQWNRFAVLWNHGDRLMDLLRSADEEDLLALMDMDEAEMRGGMPDEFAVYRACYHRNLHGLSWSLDRETAEGFLDSAPGGLEAPAILATARVRRSQTVAKLANGRLTVVSWKPKLLAIELLASQHRV